MRAWPSVKSVLRPRFVVSFVVGVCLLVVALTLGLRLYHNSTGQRIGRALGSVARADAAVTRIDEALNTPLSTETTTQVGQAQRAIPSAQRALSAARSTLDAIPSRAAAAPQTAARLTRIRSSLDARRALLNAALPLLDASVRAASALGYATAGWQSIQDAAVLTETARQQFAQQTQEAMVQSHEASAQAAEAYTQAHEQFTAAARALPEADFSAYLAYIRQRALMTQSALLASENWINGAYQDANTDVTAYNGFAQAAAAIAKDGLRLPSDIVVGVYQQQTKTAQQDYDRARAEVLRADAELR
ncbi:MAG: hypothetical protein FWC54_04230 [Actinomycetia bacterium]|nr:hypothetical protein [Actinomycetes bacterium]